MKTCNLRKQTIDDVKVKLYERMWKHRRICTDAICNENEALAHTEFAIIDELREVIVNIEDWMNEE